MNIQELLATLNAHQAAYEQGHGEELKIARLESGLNVEPQSSLDTDSPKEERHI
jgi:hypothetical protein